ncbi:CHASE2 domain-containing protein [bacterium]|nr:CHASE2 domain-containing protein [bacterium]
MPPSPAKPYPLPFWLGIAGLFWSLALLVARPWLPWDRYFFDHNLRWRHNRLPAQYPLIAHLSLGEAELNQWTTTREEYDGLAGLVSGSRDQGAAVIVLDLLLTRGKDSDFQGFWKEVYGHPDVLLARSLQETPRLPGPSQDQGLANLQRDDDGIFRRYQLYYPEVKLPSLALAAYLKVQGLAPDAFRLGRDGILEVVSEQGKPPTRFPNELYFQPRTAWSEAGSDIQFATPDDVQTWQQEGDSKFEGKAVFVGYVASGVGDVGPTVLDPSYPKVGIHATVLSNLLQNRYYRATSWPMRVGGGWCCLLLGAGAGRLLGRLNPLWLTLACLPVWLLSASHQSLWGSWLLPWVSWGLTLLSAIWVTWLWRQRIWKWRLLAMQASADFQNPLIFKTLGSYLLVEKLGEGGFGAVYRAIPAQTLDQSQVVAVKLASPSACQSPEYRKRFLRESRICRSLNHPAIVRVLESGEQDGLLYYTMQWLRGRSLRYWMLQTHSPQEVGTVLLPLVDAMAYAHAQGVLHRDLKPENIMLEHDGPQIVDFGLAFDSESTQMTAPQDVMGTLNYLAPERIEGVAHDARSDQYALGVIGYEMITGSSPFPESSNQGQALAWRLTHDPVPLGQRLNTDSPLILVIDKMMARNPDDRYATLQEALLDLQGAVGEDPNKTLHITVQG